AGAQPGLLRRPARRDALHPGAVIDRQAEVARELRVDGRGRHAEVRVPRAAVAAQLPERALDGVDGDREADAAALAARRLDLRVDAEDATAGVEQRAARVAVVDRGVGLDRADGGEAGERLDRA